MTRGLLLLALAAALFSTGGAAIKGNSFSAWQVAGLRSLIAALVVALAIPASRRLVDRRVWIVGVFYALTLMLFVTANKLTFSANAIFLQSTAPLYLVVLSPLILKERLRAADLIAGAFVGLGLWLMFQGHSDAIASAPNPALGNLLAAISGFTWAATIVGLRWLGRGDRSGLPAALAGNLIVAVIALPLALPFGPAPPLDWATVAFLGVFQVGFAYVALSAGIKHVPAVEASLILLLEPVLNPAWTWLFHNENPATQTWLGGGTIAAATLIRAIAHARSND